MKIRKTPVANTNWAMETLGILKGMKENVLPTPLCKLTLINLSEAVSFRMNFSLYLVVILTCYNFSP
jgi:hypothetical protein